MRVYVLPIILAVSVALTLGQAGQAKKGGIGKGWQGQGHFHGTGQPRSARADAQHLLNLSHPTGQTRAAGEHSLNTSWKATKPFSGKGKAWHKGWQGMPPGQAKKW